MGIEETNDKKPQLLEKNIDQVFCGAYFFLLYSGNKNKIHKKIQKF